MKTQKNHFPDISLLVTHYNRPASLERQLQAWEDLECSFGEIVVSDDGSQPQNLQALQNLAAGYGFVLVTTPVNRGLGNNINKGQRAVSRPLTLYVQEDFVPLPAFPPKLLSSVAWMAEDPSLDMVRYYAYQRFPYLEHFRDGFSVMKFNALNILGSYKKFYMYSDHPHLRRSSFMDKFGSYKEGVNVEKAEYSMMMSFLKKNGKALFYERFEDLFEQKNSSDEPSTFERDWRRHPTNLPIRIARHLYRHLRFNYNYFLN
ncbi:glycosyl transferase family 2 [Pedobacter yulinensis]|uniref:Glycosyl transferase family 2 n=1 Tax=Pedobacter yulinensis TaxID=2126353 RepID=A0A2T3HLS0_9SPHI|nr:glycosyltransferase [Pedobacter yulinensis]PST83374.1 glycosyl transferase family 2 [Pedobacter yulinensis]